MKGAIYFPMHGDIKRIVVDVKPAALKERCADAAQWIWMNRGGVDWQYFRFHSVKGIIWAGEIIEQTPAHMLSNAI